MISSFKSQQTWIRLILGLRIPLNFARVISLRDEAKNIVSYEQVTLANYRQPEDFTVLLPKVDNRITQVTSKHVGSKFLITNPMCIYEFGFLFPLQGFIRDFCYFNLRLA